MQKTNFKTRLLALLTAAFMIVMCVPFAAFAATTDPAARERIDVYFTNGDKTDKVELVKDGTSEAPPAEGGKWVNDIGAPDLASEEPMQWAVMNLYAGSDYDNVATLSYTFKADEKYNKISVSFLNADGGNIDVHIAERSVHLLNI